MGRSVALVLGAGGQYGFAHIGVLKVLEEEGLVPDLIVGSSIGSVVGALWAAGVGADFLARLGQEMRRSQWADLRLHRLGLLAGERMEGLMRLLLRGRDLENLRPPVVVVATDIQDGERVVIDRGSAARAIRASASVPGLFAPLRWQGRLLVDGAVTERLPVRTAREQGADRILAVSLDPLRAKQVAPVTSLVDVVLRSFDILQREVTRAGVTDVDVVVEPDLTLGAGSHRERVHRLVMAGHEAAAIQRRAIRELFRLRLEGARTGAS